LADYNSLKKCGFCGESIPLGAGRCPYCGSILEVTIENSYQSEPNINLNNNTSGQNTAGDSDTYGQPGADWQQGAGVQPDADAQQEQTGAYGVSEDTGAAQQESEPQEPQLQEPQPQEPGPQPQPQGPGPQQQPPIQPYMPIQGSGRPPYQSSYQNRPAEGSPILSNGLKVFLTILFTIIPGIGQIAGIITAIVFMGSPDQDKKSFGVAILVASLIMFVLSCIGCFIFTIAASSFSSMY